VVQAAARTRATTTERVEAFSDGVIAIAITLLVLTLKVPNTKKSGLFDAIIDQWPSYAAFILSFAVIGVMWVSHHSMFERIVSVDRPLLFLNLFLLMAIAFLPYPTTLLARFVGEAGDDGHIAAAMYSVNMVAIGLMFLGMWAWLARNPQLLAEEITQDRVRAAMARSMVGPIVYGITIGLAFVSAEACFVIYALVTVYFALGPSARQLIAPKQKR
jgi:uncharacterized membrane protein